MDMFIQVFYFYSSKGYGHRSGEVGHLCCYAFVTQMKFRELCKSVLLNIIHVMLTCGKIPALDFV